MPAVLRELAQHVQVDPPHRQRPAPVAEHGVVDAEAGGGAARVVTGSDVGGPHGLDGVRVVEDEGLVRGRRDADLVARPAADRLVEPDPLDEGGVLDQAEQRGARRHQRTSGLLLGEAVERLGEHGAVLVEEGLELGPQRQLDHVLGEGRGLVRHARQHPTRRSATDGHAVRRGALARPGGRCRRRSRRARRRSCAEPCSEPAIREMVSSIRVPPRSLAPARASRGCRRRRA